MGIQEDIQKKEDTHIKGKLMRYHTNFSHEEKEDLKTVCGELQRSEKKPWVRNGRIFNHCMVLS
jgi:hypothetical protein